MILTKGDTQWGDWSIVQYQKLTIEAHTGCPKKKVTPVSVKSDLAQWKINIFERVMAVFLQIGLPFFWDTHIHIIFQQDVECTSKETIL